MKPENIPDFRSRLHAISHALILAADKPIFCGVGRGITTGDRSVELALAAEFQGAMGVVQMPFRTLRQPLANCLRRLCYGTGMSNI